VIEEKIARVKKLIEQRERLTLELAGLLGMNEPSRRGRPRKDHTGSAAAEPEQRAAQSTESSSADA
jgi:hypothetical protein